MAKLQLDADIQGHYTEVCKAYRLFYKRQAEKAYDQGLIGEAKECTMSAQLAEEMLQQVNAGALSMKDIDTITRWESFLVEFHS
jgi:hypothetical protein